MMKAGFESLDATRNDQQEIDPTSVRSGFVPPSPENLEQYFPPAKQDLDGFELSVRNKLRIPAIGLLVAGIVNLLAALTFLLLPILFKALNRFDDGAGFVEGKSTFMEASFAGIVIALFSLGAGIILLIGAARMFDLQAYGIALLAALAAIVPVAPESTVRYLGAALLSRQDVKTAFADWKVESESEQDEKKSSSAVGWMMAVGLSLGLSLGAAIDPKNMGIYMIFGMMLGIAIGSVVDSNNRQNRQTNRRLSLQKKTQCFLNSASSTDKHHSQTDHRNDHCWFRDYP